MNYRHAYHAGNWADVLKHVVLALLIRRLLGKETPVRVIDTHAGAGLYDLGGEAASRTGEAAAGVRRLLSAPGLPAPFDPYLAALSAADPAWPARALRHYPGSPLVALALLRPQDRLVAVEAHPEEARALRRTLAGDNRAALHEADGYERLPALLPPRERRGLVLIDPPFEAEGEFERLVAALARAVRRWPTGIYAIWYPITRRAPADRFLAELPGLGRPALAAELETGGSEGLTGCGVAVLNPPWKLDQTLDEVLPVLHQRLCPDGRWWRRVL